MDLTIIQNKISQALPNAQVMVLGDDGVHFDAIVVSEQFEGVRPVKRQQMVYAAIGELIQTGQLHALGLKTYTPAEYAQRAHG